MHLCHLTGCCSGFTGSVIRTNVPYRRAALQIIGIGAVSGSSGSA